MVERNRGAPLGRKVLSEGVIIQKLRRDFRPLAAIDDYHSERRGSRIIRDGDHPLHTMLLRARGDLAAVKSGKRGEGVVRKIID